MPRLIEVRRIYDMQQGVRNGPGTEPMSLKSVREFFSAGHLDIPIIELEGCRAPLPRSERLLPWVRAVPADRCYGLERIEQHRPP
jgi:hypothetical protein